MRDQTRDKISAAKNVSFSVLKRKPIKKRFNLEHILFHRFLLNHKFVRQLSFNMNLVPLPDTSFSKNAKKTFAALDKSAQFFWQMRLQSRTLSNGFQQP